MRIVSAELVECLGAQRFGNGEYVTHPLVVCREIVQGRDNVMGQGLEILAGCVKREVGHSTGCSGHGQIRGRRPNRLDSPKATAGVIQHRRGLDLSVGRVAGDMRGAERHVVQEIPVYGRFPFPYVHDRASHRPSNQSFEQGGISHDFSARGIDQDGRWRHAGKFICSEHMKRRIGSVERQGDVKGHEVGPEDFREWPVSFITGCASQWRIMQERSQAQRGRLGCHEAADPAGADDPQGFSVEHEAFGVGRHEQGRQHVFRHGVRIAPKGCGKPDVPGRQILPVDMLDARGRRPHELHAGVRQQRGVHFGDGPDDERAGVPKRLAGHGSSREQGHRAEMRKRVPSKRNLFIDHESHVYLTVMGVEQDHSNPRAKAFPRHVQPGSGEMIPHLALTVRSS